MKMRLILLAVALMSTSAFAAIKSVDCVIYQFGNGPGEKLWAGSVKSTQQIRIADDRKIWVDNARGYSEELVFQPYAVDQFVYISRLIGSQITSVMGRGEAQLSESTTGYTIDCQLQP